MVPKQSPTKFIFRLKLLLLPLSLFLHSAAFPGPIYLNGTLSILAPVFLWLWLKGTSAKKAALMGLLYGAGATAATTWWLGTYDSGALILAICLYAPWFSLIFTVSRLALEPVRTWTPWLVPLVWAGAEIIRSSGPLAFPYGTIPYTLYKYRAALALSSLGGVGLVGLCIYGLSFLIYQVLTAYLNTSAQTHRFNAFIKPKNYLSLLTVIIVLAVLLGAGAPVPTGDIQTAADTSTETTAITLIQPGTPDPAKSVAANAAQAKRLIALSSTDQAQRSDIIAWHETAIVDPIALHLRHRSNRPVYEYLAELQAFLDTSTPAVLMGTGWAPPEDPDTRIRENSAILFKNGHEIARYAKMKLVPFTEYSPLHTLAPWFSDLLERRFGAFWQPGTEPKVFDLDGLNFASPICFEDSFGDHMSAFAAPRFFILLTDDSWAHSARMQEQHLSMSVFRAAETATPVLRATRTGTTAAIDQHGAVIATLPPFIEGSLTVHLKNGSTGKSLYNQGGFIVPLLIAGVAILSALYLCLLALLRRYRKPVNH